MEAPLNFRTTAKYVHHSAKNDQEERTEGHGLPRPGTQLQQKDAGQQFN
jgi:hypothetical protein